MKSKFEKRGYKVIRDKIEKNAKYNRSCLNCNCYSKEEGDFEEVCQNTEVLSFDICVEGERTWCCYWRSVKGEKSNE
jgi:hypothetical protein